jgi:hypothetical protein
MTGMTERDDDDQKETENGFKATKQRQYAETQSVKEISGGNCADIVSGMRMIIAGSESQIG